VVSGEVQKPTLKKNETWYLEIENRIEPNLKNPNPPSPKQNQLQ